MNLPPLVEILWGASFVVQLALCGILIAYRHFRRLPFFTAYVCLNVAQALFLYAIFRHYGDSSHAALLAGWWSEAITLLARVFATVEILHLVLSSYRGIWGLAWRLLAGTSAVVALICVGVASQGHADAALPNADRGFNLIFATALISCLALIRYYLIRVDNAYKVLLAGFCFYACVKILLNTVLYDFLYHQHPSYPFIWQILAVAPFVIVVIVWSAALLHPLPEKQKLRSLPTSMYGRISPEINLQLQAINRQLMNFFKIEEPQQ
jgi:hypothetical protein